MHRVFEGDGGRSRKALRVTFDTSVKTEFHGVKVSSDTGLIAYREFDETLRLTPMADDGLRNSRAGRVS